jgi:hypothetical protein
MAAVWCANKSLPNTSGPATAREMVSCRYFSYIKYFGNDGETSRCARHTAGRNVAAAFFAAILHALPLHAAF